MGCFRKISCSVYAQERFDLLSLCRTAKDVLRRDDLWKARARKSKLGMFSETMFVVCLLLRPVKEIHAAFLDNLAVLAV
jgi:hypothetical protein